MALTVFSPVTLIKSAEMNANFSGLVDMSLVEEGRLASAKYDDKGSGESKTGLYYQFGWGFVTGDGAADFATTAVTFPTAFDTILSLQIGYAGGKDSSDPSDVTDTTTSQARRVATSYGLTTSGFTGAIVSTDGANLTSGRRQLFTWVAIGTKA